MKKARYVMIGGFLGAGKTTAILRLARHLMDGGLRVGVITNDQSTGLVDTAMVHAQGHAVREITGGCFCCRFNSLVEASQQLTREAAPDVFIAEPVGSCTDLTATVSYPLRRIYGDEFTIAPLSVLVDPDRALRILGVEPGRSFSSKVNYVYQKQLEEAELIVINKIDLLTDARVGLLADALRTRFPRAGVFQVSAWDGTGLEAWFERQMEVEIQASAAPEIDYDAYAAGEALLGWLNATVRVTGEAIDGNGLLVELASRLQRRLAAAGAEIAHLKMTITPEDERGELAVVNLVATDRPAVLAHALDDAIDGGELIINVRAETDPAFLRDAVLATLSQFDGRELHQPALVVEHLEHFRPARPVPTHRMATLG